MIELDAYPYPSLLAFDGRVIEQWQGSPDKPSKRWHVRFIKSAELKPPDASGRSEIWVNMDISGKKLVGIAEAHQREPAEQLVSAIQQEIAHRGHFS